MIIAIDYGERYVGVAITDSERRLALRHTVIDQKKDNIFNNVRHIVNQAKVDKILVGVPVNLEGAETEQTFVSLRFIEKLQEFLGEDVEVVSVDETLTSVAAENHLKREGSRKEGVHAEAARIMLEDYLRKA